MESGSTLAILPVIVEPFLSRVSWPRFRSWVTWACTGSPGLSFEASRPAGGLATMPWPGGGVKAAAAEAAFWAGAGNAKARNAIRVSNGLVIFDTLPRIWTLPETKWLRAFGTRSNGCAAMLGTLWGSNEERSFVAKCGFTLVLKARRNGSLSRWIARMLGGASRLTRMGLAASAGSLAETGRVEMTRALNQHPLRGATAQRARHPGKARPGSGNFYILLAGRRVQGWRNSVKSLDP